MNRRLLSRILLGGGLFLAAIVSFAAASQMKITSSAFVEGGNVPKKFSCDGSNTSPALHFESVPAAAKSLVLIVDDPDAPGGLFTHWLVWNIDPTATDISEGRAPKGVVGQNDFGKSGYGGPCPPTGSHRYLFKVFALDYQLELSAGSKRAAIDAAMRGHIVGQGELMGRYSRSR